VLLGIDEISIEYRRIRRLWEPPQVFKALDRVSLSLHRGEIFGIVGESGSGKTTLANVIAGLTRPTSGRMAFEGQDLSPWRRTSARGAIQMVFQDPYSSLNNRMEVARAVAEPILFYGLAETRGAARAQAEALLTAVGLDAAMGGRHPHQFSGGQRQRISIARALAAQPKLLICDEPTSSLDVSVQARILDLLMDLRDARQLTLLFISHDLAVVRQICDRLAVMSAGRIVEQGDCEAVFTSPQHDYTRHLLSCVPSFSSRCNAQTDRVLRTR
jgi:peptide/nickel transport system ATP-binding protein